MSVVNKCARCEKSVYPTEELKCLDKVWHKICFKCQECGMTLNMKTYKGFNKRPYCNAHTPVAKHTTVADTPEARRLAENTKIQSQVKYHEEFERNMKGKATQMADDPELQRLKQTSKIISNVEYHREVEKKQDMENRRRFVDGGLPGENEKSHEESGVALHQLNDVLAGINVSESRNSSTTMREIGYSSDSSSQSLRQRTAAIAQQNANASSRYSEAYKLAQDAVAANPNSDRMRNPDVNSNNVRHNSQYVQNSQSYQSVGVNQSAIMTQGQQGYSRQSSQLLHSQKPHSQTQSTPSQGQKQPTQPVMHPNPNAHYYMAGAPTQMAGQFVRPPYNAPAAPYSQNIVAMRPQLQQQQQQQQQLQQQPGAMRPSSSQQAAAYAAAQQQHKGGMYAGPPRGYAQQGAPYHQQQLQQQQQQQMQQHLQQQQMLQQQQQNLAMRSGQQMYPQQIVSPFQQLPGKFQAIYDYTAQDADEVSFSDGDLIVECARVDDGWMFGRVSRTGLKGMIPSNYVVPV
ncbi:LIM and SH3 domain protein Lasp [Galendromus occidentalis]|uniref:LIM and SH3 domain protein Lasp n=1 Tax=Galendromus occidentalis TaxID=34638 RepID=A0AAJ6VXP0_9ACAR|nr:LIM and SH3 domain protein Lasp [Galendromus occidentalis]